jgi:RES domain
VKEALTALSIPLDAQDAVSYSFREPYSIGRFGDGSFGVFHSALEQPTCIAEISYHHARQLAEQQSGTFAHDRYYHLISCDFAGMTTILLGAEESVLK